MSILIPWTRIADLTIRPRLFSGNQEGVLGGEDLPTPRMGDRFAVDFITTQLRQDAESRLFIAALFEATTADARISLRLPNSKVMPGLAGAIVDGAGQAGSTINLRGLTPGATVRRGGFFSILHAGVHRVYMPRTEAMADAAGKMALPIWPMLRFLTADGDVCHFDDPMIEGQLIGLDKGAGFERNRTKPLTFTVQERK